MTATSAGAKLLTASAEQGRVLAALFAGSQALTASLIAHPDWLLSLDPESLQFPRRKEGLRNDIDRLLAMLLPAREYGPALGSVRQFKQREMLRIGARDLLRPGNSEEITLELSDLADVCLQAVWEICQLQLVERHGQPSHQDAAGRWQPTTACVISLGKLGGRELNYSSDVDVILVYEEEGSVMRASDQKQLYGPPGRAVATEIGKGTFQRVARARSEEIGRGGTRPYPVGHGALRNHQFFNRLAEAFVAELTRLAPEGMLCRIDLRLRPEGDVGPLSRSLASYENYYAQWGQTWERMMLIKARHVAGDLGLANEFLEMVQPFRYPRSINENVLREVSALKLRIENEVVRAGELERNVKLGRGGIREIEFVAQVLQLLHAGRQPFLQGAQTLACLQKLAQYELLGSLDARRLAEAW